jgi:hypothetical protein
MTGGWYTAGSTQEWRGGGGSGGGGGGVSSGGGGDGSGDGGGGCGAVESARRHSAQEAHSPWASPEPESEEPAVVEAPDSVGT